MKDENYITSLADTCLYNPAEHMRLLQHSLCTVRCLQIQQYADSAISSCMHVGECSTSSSNQFKPSFFISECGQNSRRYADVHVQHDHKVESLDAISNFEQSCVKRQQLKRKSPSRKANETTNRQWPWLWLVYSLSCRSTQFRNCNFYGFLV